MSDVKIKQPPVDFSFRTLAEEETVKQDMAGSIRLMGIENEKLRRALREAQRQCDAIRVHAEQTDAMIAAALGWK